MKPIWVELVDKGVANRFDFGDHEVIEINKRMLDYPELYNRILKHEFEHEDGSFKLKDLKHDMLSRTPGLWKFMRENPSAWYQVLPFYFDTNRKKVVYDWSTIFSWVVIFGMAYGIYSLLGWLL